MRPLEHFTPTVEEETMNATPRPWIYDYERRTIRKIEKGTGSKDDPNQYGMTLASLQQDLRMQPKQAEVNGEFIVRAVNSFDAMKEALEVAQKELRFANLTEEGTNNAVAGLTPYTKGAYSRTVRIRSPWNEGREVVEKKARELRELLKSQA